MKTNLLLLAGAGIAIFFLLPKGEAETSRSSTETIPNLDTPYSDITPKTGGDIYYNLGAVTFPQINIPTAAVTFPQINIPTAIDAPRDAGGNIAPALGTSSGNTGLKYGDTVSGVFSGITYNNPYTDYGAINAQSHLTMSKQQLLNMPITGTRQVSGDFGKEVYKDFPNSVIQAPKKSPLPPTLQKPLMPILRP